MVQCSVNCSSHAGSLQEKVLLFAARREMIGQVVQCCDKEATENNFAS
jgi:hypothetical protein